MVPPAAAVAAHGRRSAVGRRRCTRPACATNGRDASPPASTPAISPRRSVSACSTRTRRRIPTIAGHTSYFVPMLPFDTGGPRVPAIASTYPLGAVVTLSTARWDARAAIVNSSPVRNFILGAATNPRADAGLRSRRRRHADDRTSPRRVVRARRVSHAGGARAERRRPAIATLTLVGFEGDYAFRYTKVTGEVIHDTFDDARSSGDVALHMVRSGHADAHAALVRRRPPRRHVVAGRRNRRGVRRAAAHARERADRRVPRHTATSRLKASYYARQPYGRLDWDQQGGIQIVWQTRWW